jgi:integrase
MAWNRWLQFAERVGFFHDPYLLNANANERLKIFVAFAQSVRNGAYSKPKNGNPLLVAGSVQATINGVAKAFKAAGYLDPRKNERGETFLLLDRLFKGYSNQDPSTRHQQALPMTLINLLVSDKSDCSGYRHFQRLAGLAVFFAMRSCEYLQVRRSDKVPRRTLPIRACDMTFWKDGQKLLQSSPFLDLADSVSLLFRYQKNQGRDEVVTMARSGHFNFCPVVLAAEIARSINRLSQKKLVKVDAEIFHYLHPSGKVEACDTKTCLEFLRNFVRLHDPKSKGLDIARIGLHSLRATAAMAMYLSNVPVFTIMLIGRWRSLAFLSYIRKQVEQLTTGVSARMLTVDHFHTVNVSRNHTGSNPVGDQTERRTLDALAGNAIPVMGTNVQHPEAFDIWR